MSVARGGGGKVRAGRPARPRSIRTVPGDGPSCGMVGRSDAFDDDEVVKDRVDEQTCVRPTLHHSALSLSEGRDPNLTLREPRLPALRL